MSGRQARPGRRGRTRLALRLAGGGLLIAAGVIAALTGLVAMPARRGRADSGPLARLRAGAPGTGRVVSASVAATSVAALAVLGASVAAAGSSATTAAGSALRTVRISSVMVLAQ